MSYAATIDFLFSQLPFYQRDGQVAYKADIGNIVAACQALDNPHQKFKSIHIAGTNGKGSTSHMLASILQEAGYKTGLYTSPHLKDFRERIRINGKRIGKKDVVDFVSKNKSLFLQLEMSFFEMSVAMAFDFFAKENVDIAVIECGLGGRLDSTNIIQPELAIITNIGLDHTQLLGDSLEKIAQEKAGIIKKDSPIIIGRKQKETENIFKAIAKRKNAPIFFAKPENNYTSALQGIYQRENTNLVITAIRQLQKQNWQITEQNITNGLKYVIKNTHLQGRWQVLGQNPSVICDTGHNADGIKMIAQQLQTLSYQKLHFVFGVVKDKDIDHILRLLPKNAQYYFCKANIPRALASDLLQEKASAFGLFGEQFSSVDDALTTAKKNAKKEDLIFIGGSTFVVAEIL